MPSKEECPDCAFGKYHCSRTCEEKQREQQLRLYHFDFGYHKRDCFEEIPAEKGKVFLDIDVWCAEPLSIFFMNCRNMETLVFHEPTLLTACIGGASDVALAREQCYWDCKGDRPIARCVWEFDAGGEHGAEDCWLSERCDAHSNVQVDVACSPLFNTSSYTEHVALLAAVRNESDDKVNALMGQLEALNSSHDAALNRTEALKNEVARLREKNEAGDDKYEQSSMELEGLRSRFAQEVIVWEDTIRKEQAAHNKTKDELKQLRSNLQRSDDENTTLRWSVVIACLIAACGICAAAIVTLWACRRRRNNPQLPLPMDSTQVVVGLPVREDGESDPAKKISSPTHAWGPEMPTTVCRAPSGEHLMS